MAVFPRHKIGEAVGLILLSGSVLLFLSLWSHHAFDPSLNVSSPAGVYANYIGRVGAWASDLLLQLFGLSAFLLPVLLVSFAWGKMRGRGLEYPVVRSLAAACAVLGVSTCLFLLLPSLQLNLDYAPGGVAGIILGRFLIRYLNWAGAFILVVTLLFLALLTATRFSFERVLSWLASHPWDLFSGTASSYTEWRRRRLNRRELKRLNGDGTKVLAESPPRRLVLAEGSGDAGVDTLERTSGPLVSELAPLPRSETGTARDSHRADVPFQLPPLGFLEEGLDDIVVDEPELIKKAEKITAKYSEFEVHGRVLQIHPGPVVTTFEFKPDPGVKYTRVTSLTDDLCLALKAESIRIDRIPGKNTVGLEVPNRLRHTILLREILGSTAFQESGSQLTLGVGKLINGNTFVADLARMPHLLIAGATGSGKSVAINCMICSVLYKATPQDVKFILVDPKRLELGLYEDIPHLLTPIVTDPKQAANALNWAVREMELRYKLLARCGVRNLEQYNQLVSRWSESEWEDDEKPEPLPLILVVVDELADLMMTAGKEVEASLTRLAQMARAIGIHLILATQRPSVDVITGLIKANFPSRISFRVSSKVDSRTILDANGAEQLLGQGDMLFLSPRTARPVRLHGGLITEEEIRRITSFLCGQAQPDYQEEILEGTEEREALLPDLAEADDPFYDEAARFVVETGKASTSLLQRRLRVGYGRAARLLDMMEHEGLVGPPVGSRPREVRVPPDYFDQIDDS